MRCVKCKNLDTKVIDSRLGEEGRAIRRRRECEKCGARFTTFERVEFISFMVTKSDGRKEVYERSKVQSSILKAFNKRNVDHAKIEQLINELENEWAQNKRGITSKRIGRDVLGKLRDIDEVAYVRYASIYNNFEDIQHFLEFIREEFS